MAQEITERVQYEKSPRQLEGDFEKEFRTYNEIEYVDKLDQALTPQPNPLELISKDPLEGLRG
jgi:hypothetical protein